MVKVQEAFMHCGKSMVRSRLWNADFWPDRSNVPTIAGTLKAYAKASESIEDLQKREDQVTVSRLY